MTSLSTRQDYKNEAERIYSVTMDRYAIITAVNMEAVRSYSVINMVFIAE